MENNNVNNITTSVKTPFKVESEACWRMMLKEQYRMLKLYQIKLKHLEARNNTLQLARHLLHDAKTDNEKLTFIQMNRTAFNNKIQSIREEIDKLLSLDEKNVGTNHELVFFI